MPPHLLTNFEIRKYYQDEAKHNSVYSRNNLPKIKDGEYVINLDEYESIGTHCKALYVNTENVTYFHSFVVEHIQKDIRKFNRNENVTTNIYRVQAYHSVMCRYLYIGFIDFMLKGKSFLEYTNLFSPNKYKKIMKIMKIYCNVCNKYKKSKKIKISYIVYHIFSIVYSKCGHEYEKISKEE